LVDTTVKVTLPEMGESVTEGSIVEWRKKAGEWIDEGDTLVDVTTDKVDVEVPATASGVIKALFGQEGDTVAVGATLAEIDTSAAKPSGGAPATASPASSAPAASAPSTPTAAPAASASPASYGSVGGNAASNTRANAQNATSRALSFAKEHNLDISSVPGTGPNGLISRLDVIVAASTGKAKPLGGSNGQAQVVLPPPPASAKITQLKGPNAALVGYMEQSLTIPTATSFRTLGVGVLEQQRATLNAALKSAGRSEKISFTHLIAYAIARTVREIPDLGATFRRDNGVPQRVESGVNLGLAVDAQRKDGTRFLVVPVIKNAGNLDFKAFHAAYDDLVVKARDGKLSADELTGANITLTNPGGIGTVASVPRLLAGQGVIVAAGAIGYPPGFANAPKSTLEQLGIEKVMGLTSTYDHRVIQGAQSGEFLRRLEQLLAGADGFYDSIKADLRLDGSAAPQANNAAALASTPNTAVKVPSAANGALPSIELLRTVASGMAIVSAYRDHGHLNANLDPLSGQPVGDPSLDPANYGLDPASMQAVPASILKVKIPGETLADVLPRLQEIYSSTIAYEIEHISNNEQRSWLRDYIESGAHRVRLSGDRAVRLLSRLTKVETMERYLRKSFIGFKTFSSEGLDVVVPILEELISLFADDQIETAVIGMAHRGRLGTIAHVVNRPYEEILGEFEAAETRGEGYDDDVTGDVKYHHGAKGVYETFEGRKIAVQLASNPSHLEAVNGVVEGLTRALQTAHDSNIASHDRKKAAAILIHGDAAFSGQGVVAEVLNLQALAGYNIGGTVHIIANNQVGFTTDPIDDRSTRYASDLAKGFDVPIIHVNADDVEACIAATHLAFEFRRRFGHDVLIDVIGYRRLGHNETDEPAYTQPGMYDKIKSHPTVREIFSKQLIADGLIAEDKVAELQGIASRRISEAHAQVKSNTAVPKLIKVKRPKDGDLDTPIDTRVSKDVLDRLGEELVAVEPGFTVHPKLAKQFDRRKAAYTADGEVDWGLAEALAFSSLLVDGSPIRLTGQDSERGTFSHRHLVLHDPKTEKKYAPIQHLSSAKASFEVYNSPLSEYACLGFEYGYAGAVADALVIWEAQFGDFNNGAQIIIDQFIAAGQAKWGDTSRLTLLLPHGYEGQGPEHSSARLERFLQLSAEGNLRIANCTTAAQYFHLLRSQAKDPFALPLIVMSPKSLLRSRPSYANVKQLTSETFQHVIDDANAATKRDSIERVILCSGKVYYDLVADEAYKQLKKTAIVRIEVLAPFPVEKILALLGSYPNLKQVFWTQEEPSNMGAHAHVVRRLCERLPKTLQFGYIGRPHRASPSEGYPGAHAGEQERIVRTALAE
jgi:2-oxoglutarate decarboxylase